MKRKSLALFAVALTLVGFGWSLRKPVSAAYEPVPQTPVPLQGPVSGTGLQIPTEPVGKAQYPPILDTSFADGDFPKSDWEVIPVPAPGNSQFSTTVQASGGRTGGYLAIQILPSAGPPGPGGRQSLAHILKGTEYRPDTEGELLSVEGGFFVPNQGGGSRRSPLDVGLLLRQDGVYYAYAGPFSGGSSNGWTRRYRKALRAEDFVEIQSDFTLLPPFGPAPRHPDFSCAARPIQVGFIVSPAKGAAFGTSEIDDWSVTFHSKTCCRPAPSPGRISPFGRGLGRVFSTGPVFSGPCCDDDSLEVDADGTVLLPADADVDSPPIVEYVDEEVGLVNDLYPGIDTSVAGWYEKFPCKKAIGDIVPPGAETPDPKAELEEVGVTGVDPGDMVQQVIDREQEALQAPPLFWRSTPVATYDPPPRLASLADGAFGGRDIVFIHGLKLEHITDRLTGVPGAQVDWRAPKNHPADVENPEFYSGYYKEIARRTWVGDGTEQNPEGHIGEFLKKKGYKNRFLIVSYNCSDRLPNAVEAVLAQIGDAMSFGTGVVDPRLAGPLHRPRVQEEVDPDRLDLETPLPPAQGLGKQDAVRLRLRVGAQEIVAGSTLPKWTPNETFRRSFR